MKLKLLIERYEYICEWLAEVEMAAAMDGEENCNNYFNGEYYALLIEKEQIEEMEV